MSTPEEPTTPVPASGGTTAGQGIPDFSHVMPPPRPRARRGALVAGAGLLALVVLVGIGVVIGRFTAPSGPSTLAAAVRQAKVGPPPHQRLGPPRAGGPGGGGRGLVGTVQSLGDGTITIQTRRGAVQLTLPSNVTVEKTVPGSTSDLATGDTVHVTTVIDPSGKRAVQRIVIVPRGPGAPAGGATG